MTRINLVPPGELSRQHLLAEYRELPRVFRLAQEAYRRGELPRPDRPAEYTLGTGHVRFFYPRLGFLVKRHGALVKEMDRRGYRVNYRAAPATTLTIDWYGDYVPTPEALALNRARIAERSA